MKTAICYFFPEFILIRANHTLWAKKVFDIYVSRLLKQHFHAFHFLGEIPETDPQLPLLLLPNHSSWWDGFLVYLLNKKIFKRPLYLMMLEKELSKYGFFSRVGAYSIQPGNPKDVLESLHYTAGLLGQKETIPLVCIFPQGELKPWGKRPLGYKRGVEWILNRKRNSEK